MISRAYLVADLSSIIKIQHDEKDVYSRRGAQEEEESEDFMKPVRYYIIFKYTNFFVVVCSCVINYFCHRH
jgi:hypothetical protein